MAVLGEISRLVPHEDAAPKFSYEEAFSRNLGWVTAAEQQILRGKRIAMAGLGGVGGSHLLTLARLGIGAFHIADFDHFELANFNRQAGATMASLGRPKAETLAAMARDINPELDLKVFPQGIDESNLDAFLAGVDIYVDSLDFFVLELRRKLFARCAALGIPAITAAPIGMGTGYLIFMPGRMTFEEYFRLEGLPPEKQRVNFALGLTPRGFQRGYLVDLSRVDFKGKRVPSLALSCELCAGVTAAEVLKILLKRGPVRAAPWYHQFDAYTGKWARGRLPGGNRNPLQRLKLALAYRMFEKISATAPPPAAEATSDLDYILDQARWAPSGDNTQPWRFEILGPDRVIVHIRGSGDLFDYRDGEPTLLAAGMLLESMRIAASARQRALHWDYLGEGAPAAHRIEVTLLRSPQTAVDPLAPYITIRSVDRRPYRSAPLSHDQRAALSAALGDGLEVLWHETLGERWRAVMTNALGSDIRLRLPEAFQIHREVLDWQRDFSPWGIPVGAVGLNPASRRMMRWVMGSWRRMNVMNRSGATALTRFELDVIPGLLCGAHFTIVNKSRPNEAEGRSSLLEAGQSLQRFWLTATQLGLALQPSFAPLWFAHFSRREIAFTDNPQLLAKSGVIAQRLDAESSGRAEDILFRGRLGYPAVHLITSRSMRRELREMTIVRSTIGSDDLTVG